MLSTMNDPLPSQTWKDPCPSTTPWKMPSSIFLPTKVAVKEVLLRPCTCSMTMVSRQTLPDGKPGLTVSSNYRHSAVTSANSLTSTPLNYLLLPIVSAMPTPTLVSFPISLLLVSSKSHGHRLLNAYSLSAVAQAPLTQYQQANVLTSSVNFKATVSIVAIGDTERFTALVTFPLVPINL